MTNNEIRILTSGIYIGMALVIFVMSIILLISI